MLHLQTIVSNTLELLKTISARPEMQGMRLVGGTSLALQYGHRQSVVLDFFGKALVPQDEMLSMIENVGPYRLRNRTSNILQLIVDGVMVDIVDYSRYAWIDNPICVEGLTLASPKDIAAMKINAIEERGSRKDFIDIYLLLQHFSGSPAKACVQNKGKCYLCRKKQNNGSDKRTAEDASARGLAGELRHR